MRIRTQFIVTMGLFALILSVIAVSLIATNRQVDRLSEQQRIAQDIERGARELSYLSNDYLLYRESQQRTRWESKFAAFSQDLSRLQTTVPEQRALVNNIKSNQERMKAVFSDVVSTLQSAEFTPDAAGLAFIQLSWSRMEVQNQGIVFDAHLLSQKLDAEIDQSRQTNAVLILALVGLFAAYFVANYGLVYRRTLRAIFALQEGTHIIGSGQLEYQISEKSTDEIGELARAFNRMTKNLREVMASKADLEREITERKEAEARIQRLNSDLEQQAETLKQINIQLEETLAEEQVAREEAEAGRNVLESLMEYAPEVILIADAPDARIRMISRYAETLLGHALPKLSQVLAEEHPLSRGLYQPDGVTRMPHEETPIARAVKRGETILDREMVLVRPDGARRTLVVNAGPIRDGRGNITGGIATWRDITVRKQIEQQVQTLNRDLERRAVELEIANKELESFSYSVSHDLRTPLASIHGFANLLLKDCGAQLPSDAMRYLELIRDNSTEMNQLVDGLLAFSRFIRQPLRKQTVDLNKLVRQALEDLRAQQQDRRIEVEIGDLPACQADPVLLKQVFINLLSNAFKFTRTREVAHIEIETTRTDDGELFYSVRDNGVGFDPDHADNLFGVFQRLHSQEDYEGTGVGLAIVERIVKRHGGRIYAESQVDKGASFHFTIPG